MHCHGCTSLFADYLNSSPCKFSRSTAGFPFTADVSYAMARFERSVTLTFTWRLLVPRCRDIHYIILASNCGGCPTTTKNTTVTCTDVPTDGSVCTFTVQTVVCGNIAGNSSVLVPLLDDHNPDVKVIMVITFEFKFIAAHCY